MNAPLILALLGFAYSTAFATYFWVEWGRANAQTRRALDLMEEMSRGWENTISKLDAAERRLMELER